MGTARPKIPCRNSQCKTWSSYIQLVNDGRKTSEWRQGRPWHWRWSIEQPKCTWKPEREGYNGECVRLMHNWKSYEIYLWVRWPSRDEKMWPHSLCEIKQRRSAIFYRILRNQHSPSIYTWWTFWEYMYLWKWCKRKLRHADSHIPKMSAWFKKQRKGTIFYLKISRPSKVSLVATWSNVQIFLSGKISRGGKVIRW